MDIHAALWTKASLDDRRDRSVGQPERDGRCAKSLVPAVRVLCALAILLLSGSAWAGRQVIDLLGRTMVVPDQPRRVIALAPSITEIIYALGQERRLSGVTRFSDYPAAAKDLPKVGSYVHLDLEKIVSLAPDLCIAIKDGNPKAVVERLQAFGIPVFAVDPRGMESVIEAVVRIGALLDAESAAEAIVADMRSRIERIRRLVATTDSRPRVFFQIGLSPIVSVGSDTFIHELIRLAGGDNVAKGPVPYPRFSREQVIALAPEVIIITSMARAAVFDQVKAQWSRWSDIPAVKHDRIVLQESNLFDRPTPRLIDGLELLVKIVHPELFPEQP